MTDRSRIEWTDATWNPFRGTKGRHHCVRISEGCKNCYAAAMNQRFKGPDYVKGADTPRLDEEALLQPLKWKKARRIFVCSMTDLFMDEHTDEMIDRVFAVMALSNRGVCRPHTFQVLTKRAKRMRDYFSLPLFRGFPGGANRMHRALESVGATVGQATGAVWRMLEGPLPNVWLGVSAENQERANERIPDLLATPAAVRFVSAEPLLGPINLARYLLMPRLEGHCATRGVHWVIVGGESGARARPCDVAWIRSIKRQCQAARVALFVKQLGANVRDRNDAGFDGDSHTWAEGEDAGKPVTPTAWPDAIAEEDRIEWNANGFRDEYQGAPVRIRLKAPKGGDVTEWPFDLRVREMPRGAI